MPDLIALVMPAGKKFIEELQRAWDAGHAIAPIDTRLPPLALERTLDALAPAVVISPDGERHVRKSAEPVESGDALVVATSGTTGEAKGVVLTHAAVAASARITSKALGVSENDHWLACLPPAHIGGLSVITRSLITGTRLTCHASFEATAVTSAARNKGVTLISLVPTALSRVDSSIFRRVLLGGSTPPTGRPNNVFATYGMTETGSGVVYEHRPLDEVDIRVEETGELIVKSPTLLRCYRDGQDPKTTDGWFATGDAGEIDAGGSVVVHGRMADVIVTGGEKVWPSVVEQRLKAHESVGEALVTGWPDPQWGQKVVAVVELVAPSTTRPTLAELRDWTKATLPSYCAPKELQIVSSLERTASGKIRREPK